MSSMIDSINAFGREDFFTYGLFNSILMILLFLGIAYILRRIIQRYVKRKQFSNEAFIMRMVRIVIYTLASYACLSLFKPFDSILGKLWGSAGILAVVFGLAAQESLGNMVNGILISTFKPFHIGDLVKVDNGEYEGYVVDISLRHTVIQTYENTRIIIPNSVMNKAVLENISLSSSNANFLFLQISYESDLDKAMQIIREEAEKHPHYMDIRNAEEIAADMPDIVIRVIDFMDSGIQLRATIPSRSKAEGFAMLSDLRISIKKRFDAEGIEFPYPHRTIVYKKEEI